MFSNNYNPDILSCIANLSSDEVFTSPKLVNQILDLLPSELWSDRNATFLDPGCKSGVFLREIAKRLESGLEVQIPDRKERMNHIFKNQLYGLAITELTALISRRSVYCSKAANGKYSACETFDNPEGNIRFDRIEHTWKNGRCEYCGANEDNYERSDELESHAYSFIHTDQPEEIFNMKFDVIIGNPPYQLSDGGFGRSASPVYQKFVQQAKKLNPRFLTMIIPARWFAGGKGLGTFRDEMLQDTRLRKLVDFESATEVFPGVDIAGGVCYFLWDRDYLGLCEITNASTIDQKVMVRSLCEFPTLIRSNEAIPIVRKVLQVNENGGSRLSERVSKSKPFGLRTYYKPTSSGVPCWFIQKIGLKYAKRTDVTDNECILDKWKLLIPRSPIAGQTDFSKPVSFYYDGNTRIAKPGECCTESWIVAGAFLTEAEVLCFKSYLFTKVIRFLLLQTVVSQDVTRKNFSLIPDLGVYNEKYTDDKLVKRWRLTKEEWAFIDSKIRTVECNNE